MVFCIRLRLDGSQFVPIILGYKGFRYRDLNSLSDSQALFLTDRFYEMA